MKLTDCNHSRFIRSGAFPALLLVLLLLSVQIAALVHQVTHHHALNHDCPVCSVLDRSVTDQPDLPAGHVDVSYFLIAIAVFSVAAVILSPSSFSSIRAPPAFY